MLRSLAVRNFAVISELRLEFGPGLTVFTGETGAGKSIVIEALGFLMGQRGSVDWLRSGEQKLEVGGIFDRADLPESLRAEFAQKDSPQVVVRRELDASGRSRAWINGRPAALSALSVLSERLVDFHGQHEHQTLLKPAMQLELLDGFGELDEERLAVGSAYRRWKELKAGLEALALSDEERLRLIDLYRFQVRDIDEADPKTGEEEALATELPRLKNASRLDALAEQAHGLLYEQEGSAQELLCKVQEALVEMARLDPSLAGPAEALRQSREQVSETAAVLAGYRERAPEGPEKLDEILGRQDKLARLKKKYGATLSDVLAYREKTAAELARLENYSESARDTRKKLDHARAELEGSCERLHRARMKAAKKLGEWVASELGDLGMAAARLTVSVEMEDGAVGASGGDLVEFLLAPNPGEPLKPLRSIASGGELSRVMLALKTVLARQDRVGLLVFDEVDTGVGAVVGRCVGEKLAELGSSRQVLVVTHLPQVACFAREHFSVSKAVSGGRTTTKVERLDGDARLEAIARMLGGRGATEVSRRHAKELLESL